MAAMPKLYIFLYLYSETVRYCLGQTDLTLNFGGSKKKTLPYCWIKESCRYRKLTVQGEKLN